MFGLFVKVVSSIAAKITVDMTDKTLRQSRTQRRKYISLSSPKFFVKMEAPIATVGRWELKHTMCQQNNLFTTHISNLK